MGGDERGRRRRTRCSSQVGSKHVGGLDLDTCRDKATGELEPWAQTAIDRFDTYTEVSPSETGVKLFFTIAAADLPAVEALFGGQFGRVFKRSNDGEHPPAIEIYRGRRYFAVTWKSCGTREDLRQVSVADLEWLVRDHGPKFVGKDSSGGAKDDSRSAKAFRAGAALKAGGATYEQMRDALLRHEYPEIAEWARTKGMANNERELRRVYDRAGTDGEGVRLEDFVAYMQRATTSSCPPATVAGARVDARLSPVPLLDTNGKPVIDKKTGKPEDDQGERLARQERAGRADDLGAWIRAAGPRQAGRRRRLDRPERRDRVQPVSAADARTTATPRKAGPWINHVQEIYPDEAGPYRSGFSRTGCSGRRRRSTTGWFSAALQGIGKDTLLEPVKYAVGAWNFEEVSPPQMLGRFNGFLKSVVLRISEAKDLGDIDRYKFYDHMKPILAAPPDVLRVDEKNLREHDVFNVCGVDHDDQLQDQRHLPAGRRPAALRRLEREDEGRLHRRLLERTSGAGTSAGASATSPPIWPSSTSPASTRRRRRPRRPPSGRSSTPTARRRTPSSPTFSTSLGSPTP